MLRHSILALAGGMLTISMVHAQDVYYPNYLIYRVNLDGITGNSTALLSNPGGFGGPGGDPMSEGSSGDGGFGGPPSSAFGGPPSSGFGGIAPTDNLPDVDLTKTIVAIIPSKKIVQKPVYPQLRSNPNLNPEWFSASCKYGTVYLYARGNFMRFTPLPQRLNPERNLRLMARNWTQTDNQNEGLKVITTALNTGQVDAAYRYAEDFAKYIDKNPDKALAGSTRFVKAYREMLPKLEIPARDNGDGRRWRDDLHAKTVDTSAHFALVSWGDLRVSSQGIKRRLDLLEENMRGFYLWQALDGRAVAMPSSKLVVVLAPDPDDLPRLREAMNGSPIVADGFHATGHNVVVLSPERRDTVGRSFNAYLQTRYKEGWNREELLKGNTPPVSENRNGLDVIEMTTLAVIDAAVEEQANRAMITSNGTRQLYAAAGLLPKHVHLPEWLESGTARLLMQSDEPYFEELPNKTANVAIGLGVGYGSPHYRLIREYAQLNKDGYINPDSAEWLRNTVMDAYFEAAREESDIDPPPALKPEEKGLASTSGTPTGSNPFGSTLGGGSSGGPRGGFGGSTPGGPPSGFGGPPSGFRRAG